MSLLPKQHKPKWKIGTHVLVQENYREAWVGKITGVHLEDIGTKHGFSGRSFYEIDNITAPEWGDSKWAALALEAVAVETSSGLALNLYAKKETKKKV